MSLFTHAALRRWLSEPLVHFAALGASLFALHAAVGPGSVATMNTVVVSEDTESWLADQFRARTGRGPTATEREAIVREFVDEEVLYREGLALGIDRRDPIVRRRIVQRMRFLLEDAGAREPTEDELSAYVAANRERYAGPDRFDLRHVFFSSDRHSNGRVRAEGCMERLTAGNACEGDPFVHGNVLRGRSLSDLSTEFGPELAQAVQGARVGDRSVMSSALGWHVVWVEQRTKGEVAFERVRVRAAGDWRRDRTSEDPLGPVRVRYEIAREAGA